MMTLNINWESLLKITHAENNLVVYLIILGLNCHTDVHSHVMESLADNVSSDINALILDYLTTEGYSSAAAKFSKEANLHPQQEEESVIARQKIQHAIHLGSIEDAIDSLNDLEPSVSLYALRAFPLSPRCYD